jgi:hypothetical protein
MYDKYLFLLMLFPAIKTTLDSTMWGVYSWALHSPDSDPSNNPWL